MKNVLYPGIIDNVIDMKLSIKYCITLHNEVLAISTECIQTALSDLRTWNRILQILKHSEMGIASGSLIKLDWSGYGTRIKWEWE